MTRKQTFQLEQLRNCHNDDNDERHQRQQQQHQHSRSRSRSSSRRSSSNNSNSTTTTTITTTNNNSAFPSTAATSTGKRYIDSHAYKGHCFREVPLLQSIVLSSSEGPAASSVHVQPFHLVTPAWEQGTHVAKNRNAMPDCS